jgi:hypothetical protein
VPQALQSDNNVSGSFALLIGTWLIELCLGLLLIKGSLGKQSAQRFLDGTGRVNALRKMS